MSNKLKHFSVYTALACALAVSLATIETVYAQDHGIVVSTGIPNAQGVTPKYIVFAHKNLISPTRARASLPPTWQHDHDDSGLCHSAENRLWHDHV